MEVKTLNSCGTKLSPIGTSRSGSALVMSWPSKVILPPLTPTSPNTAFRIVDLPAPLGPTMTPISAASMAMSTPWRMGAPP